MNPVALIVGAGDATGGAVARRFAREGYTACVTRRQADKLQPLVERIHAEGVCGDGLGAAGHERRDGAREKIRAGERAATEIAVGQDAGELPRLFR